MKNQIALAAAVCLWVLGHCNQASALVIFGRLEGDNIGHSSYWPEGLKGVVLAHPRVAGDMWDAPTFVDGVAGVNLCFRGDQQQFNEFLRAFAEVKHDQLTLRLHPGKGVYGENVRGWAKVEEPVEFDWHLQVHASGLLNGAEGPKTTVSVSYYLDDRAHLMGLEVPANIEVSSGAEPEVSESPTVKAINNFIRLRKS